MGYIKLRGLLSVIKSAKPITIHLLDKDGLELITFIMDGYSCLEDVLEEDEVTEVEIVNMQTLNIKIDTTPNP